MNLKEFVDVKAVAEKYNITLLYCGPFSETMMLALGDALREKMAEEDTDSQMVKNVFSIFVEQAQNVIRYSACTGRVGYEPHSEECLRPGLIAIGTEEDRYFVVCQNRVENDKVDHIRTQLDEIRQLDKQAIRKLFRERMREEPHAASKGAGLGLIEIARRSSLPVEYAFEEDGEAHKMFSLKAYV